MSNDSLKNDEKIDTQFRKIVPSKRTKHKITNVKEKEVDKPSIISALISLIPLMVTMSVIITGVVFPVANHIYDEVTLIPEKKYVTKLIGENTKRTDDRQNYFYDNYEIAKDLEQTFLEDENLGRLRLALLGEQMTEGENNVTSILKAMNTSFNNVTKNYLEYVQSLGYPTIEDFEKTVKKYYCLDKYDLLEDPENPNIGGRR